MEIFQDIYLDAILNFFTLKCFPHFKSGFVQSCKMAKANKSLNVVFNIFPRFQG